MHRIEGADFVTVGGKKLFTDGPPGTVGTASWLNAIQEEISNVIEDAGGTLQTAATETRNQLLTYLKVLFVEPSASETLTNKTIEFGDNTLTDVASTNTAQSLTNKTIDSASNTLTVDSTDANTTLAIDTSEALTSLDLDTADAGTTVDINSGDANTTLAINTAQANTSLTVDSANGGTDITLDTGDANTNLTVDSADAGTDITLDGTDAATSMTNVESVEETGTNTYELKYKYVDIGNWNMDSTGSFNIAHGLTDANIIYIQTMIRNDDAVNLYTLEAGGYATITIGSGLIVLYRVAGGFFDDPVFNEPAFNRGWVLITYHT